jgi:uncharacterized protein YjiS (DUF1127 family)
MAYFDHSFVSNRSSLRQRIGRLFETPFDRRYRQRTDQITKLRAKTDAELAVMGLRREDILLHVFANRATIR